MVEIAIAAGNVTTHRCDLLILKHADGFYGADAQIAGLIDFRAGVAEGNHVVFSGGPLKAREIMFVGVRPLPEFRYEQIRHFAHDALKIVAGDKSLRFVATTLHGPGYGLDERESLLSLVAGFFDAIEAGEAPPSLERIDIVELSTKRATRLGAILNEALASSPIGGSRIARRIELEPAVHPRLANFGAKSEYKSKLFVAMPFAEDHSDVWEIAIQEACQHANLMCERIDKAAYTGDVLAGIKERVRSSNGVVALLNDANPNVFLEVGFAWGAGKPTVLIVKEGLHLPFDVQGQKCLIYKSIADLRTQLTNELKTLKQSGIF